MKIIAFAVFTAAVSLLLGCQQTPTPNLTTNASTAKPAASPQIEMPPAADQLAVGKKLYMNNCAVCHKENGTGGKISIEGKSINPDDLTSAKIKAFSDDKITGYIYNGLEDEGMPAFKDKLSEAEIREVVGYVRAGIQNVPLPATNSPQ
ncbi:MAG: cytochrome c [Pyrinomonadaceae bacterium]